MLSRLVAFLLTFALCWSSLSAQELVLPAVPGSDAAQSAGTASSPNAGSNGSAGDHHRDDRPVQPPAESQADLPGLLCGAPAAATSALRMARPAPFSAAALHPPYLDALQRPPCAIDLIA